MRCVEKAPVKALAFFLFVLFSSVTRSDAQNRLSDIRVSIDVKDRPFQEVLSQLQTQIPFKFAYSMDLVWQQKNVSVTARNQSLADLLTLLLGRSSLSYTFIGNEIVLQNRARPHMVTLSGYIKDARSGELLTGASIYFPRIKAGVISNRYGFYSITFPASDSLAIEVSYVGYKCLRQQLGAGGSLTATFDLEHSPQQESINKLIIEKDKREDNVKKNQPAVIDLADDALMTAPSFSGGGDVINSIQMSPGVQADLAIPGYRVRGGKTGQNLVLLDGATIYNPSHVFRLVSIFNGVAIKNALLLKGGFPASYGDHISSVLDVVMKDGSKQQFGGAVQLSPLASGITLHGPLGTEKSSFLIAARRSTIDWLLHPFHSHNYFSNYYFYDLNGKMNYRLSSRDRLLLSFYKGLDKNGDYTDATGSDHAMHFGNQAFALRWNHLYSGELFSNVSVIYNRYHQFLSANQSGYFAQLYSGIRDIKVKADLSYYLNPSHKITGGLNYLYQTLYSASVFASTSYADSGLFIAPGRIPEKHANRVAAYFGDEIKLGDRVDLYAGVRAPFYCRPEVQYMYIEPRFSALFLVNGSTSVKASYSLMHQYIHLVQGYNTAFRGEIWIGSSPRVQPQVSHEFSGGIYKNFSENIFQVSLEGYYKFMGHQLLFKSGTTPTIDNSSESQLVFGKGRSYGAELLVRKNRGRLTGWLAYTLAYSWLQFDSLNSGHVFPAAFDRRHRLCLAAAYELSPHWKVSAEFYMASGRAFTLATRGPDSTSFNPLYDYDSKDGGASSGSTGRGNNYRLSPRDRLNLGVSYKKSRVIRHKPLEIEWTLSVYNVYARHNTSFVYRAIDPVARRVVARQASMIPVIPTLTYSLRF